METLLRAYPDALDGFDGTYLIWRDGTRMPVDDGRPDKTMEEQIRDGSILDQLRLPYPAGAPCCRRRTTPAACATGRSSTRCMATARPGEVSPKLVRIVWLPKTWGHAIQHHLGQRRGPPAGRGLARTRRIAGRGQEIPVSDRRHL